MNAKFPFEYKGSHGFLSVEYCVSSNPERMDYDLLPNREHLMNYAFGYPYIFAKLTDYDGFGIKHILPGYKS